MKRLLYIITVAITCLPICKAQTAADVTKNINKVKPLVDNHGWEYDILLDPNGDFKRSLGCQMIPFTLIVDGKGNIVYKHNGYTDGEEMELLEKVRDLIK